MAMTASYLKQPKFHTSLIGRGLQGFQSRADAELQATGVEKLDALLGGGFPRGSMVELCGLPCSGRTSLTFSLLAQTTGRQECCAYVDVSNSLDPMSLAAAGVELPRLLWVRCGDCSDQEPDRRNSSFASADNGIGKAPASSAEKRKIRPIPEWSHPRESMRGIDQDIPSLVGNQAVFANPRQIHVIARCAANGDTNRRPARQGIPVSTASDFEIHNISWPKWRPERSTKKVWKRLEQALKTTDLLLHAGGWGVVVFDLGGIAQADTRRINLSIWFRFRRAVANTPTILLLLGEAPCANSCASLVLRCQRTVDNWSRAARGMTNGISTLEGFEVEGEVTRSRVLSPTAQRVRWQTLTA